MNQQRARRYKSAKERQEKQSNQSKQMNKHKMKNINHLKSNLIDTKIDTLFDSNCITPGTLFMHKFNEEFILKIKKLKIYSQIWNDCNVI